MRRIGRRGGGRVSLFRNQELFAEQSTKWNQRGLMPASINNWVGLVLVGLIGVSACATPESDRGEKAAAGKISGGETIEAEANKPEANKPEARKSEVRKPTLGAGNPTKAVSPVEKAGSAGVHRGPVHVDTFPMRDSITGGPKFTIDSKGNIIPVKK